MDSKQQFGSDTNRPVMDVRPPGATPAMPNAKPVFTNDQPLQPDPMMTNTSPSFAPSASNQPLSPSVAIPVTDGMSDGVSSAMPSMESNLGTNPQPPAAPSQPNYAPPAETPSAPHPLISGDASSHQMSHPQAMYGSIKHTSKLKKFAIFVLVLLVLAGIGVGAYVVIGKKDGSQTSTQQTQAPAAVPETKKDTTYTSPYGVFTFDNKYEWAVTAQETTDKYQPVRQDGQKYGTLTFAINDKQNLVFDINDDQRGGSCEPKTNDVAFKAGNFCDSKEILTAVALPEASYPKDKRFSAAAKAYVVTYKFMDAAAQAPTTLAGITFTTLDAVGTEVPLEIAKPTMGAFLDFTTLALSDKVGYLDVKIVDAKGVATQLSDADLAKVVEVLKTFKLK